MRFNDYELAMIWLALLLEQGAYEEGSKGWLRHERIIRKIENRLKDPDNSTQITERPIVTEVQDNKIKL